MARRTALKSMVPSPMRTNVPSFSKVRSTLKSLMWSFTIWSLSASTHSADGAYRYWQQRVERLRNTLKKRPNLLWGYIQDAFELSQAQMEDYFGPRPDMPSDAY